MHRTTKIARLREDFLNVPSQSIIQSPMFARIISVAVLSLTAFTLHASDKALTFSDPQPQRYEFTARASEIDPRTRPHPEIDFVFEKNGKPADINNASVDTRVKPQGKLVIWLMGYSAPLFERVNSYGLHAIRVHYANGWFSKFGQEPPPADTNFSEKSDSKQRPAKISATS